MARRSIVIIELQPLLSPTPYPYTNEAFPAPLHIADRILLLHGTVLGGGRRPLRGQGPRLLVLNCRSRRGGGRGWFSVVLLRALARAAMGGCCSAPPPRLRVTAGGHSLAINQTLPTMRRAIQMPRVPTVTCADSDLNIASGPRPVDGTAGNYTNRVARAQYADCTLAPVRRLLFEPGPHAEQPSFQFEPQMCV